MKLAALLHDANDRKYFKNELKDFHIMVKSLSVEVNNEKIYHPEYRDIINEALYMISLVSSSENGNKVPELALY